MRERHEVMKGMGPELKGRKNGMKDEDTKIMIPVELHGHLH
jgi:hypothetical protein